MTTTVDMSNSNSSIEAMNNSTSSITDTYNDNSTFNGSVYNDNSTFNGSVYHANNPHEGEIPTPFIVFIFGSFGLGAIFRILLQKWAFLVGELRFGKVLKIPYTVFLMIFGVVLAFIGFAQPHYVEPFLAVDLDPNLFIGIFLPVIIFESAFVIDIHLFWRSFGVISFLAVSGLLLSTAITTSLSFFVPGIIPIESIAARFYVAIIFGATLSTTDPVAVVALLRELGCQKYMGGIMEGEALLKEGGSFVLFKIFLYLLQSLSSKYEDLEGVDIALLVLQEVLLGPIIGYVVAVLESNILQQIYNDSLAEITITLSFTYLTFHIGEVCKTSGVMAVVALGLILDRSSISSEANRFLYRFWEMLAYLCNTLIFVIVGVLIARFSREHAYTGLEIGHLLLLYVGVLLARTLSVFTFYPIIRRLGLDITWKHVVVMIWSGLRGAIGLVMAVYLTDFNSFVKGEPIIVPENATTRPRRQALTTTEATDNASVTFEPIANINFDAVFDQLLRHTAGIVMLTLVINAGTMEAVLKRLGMLEVTGPQRITMMNAVNQVRSIVKRMITVLKYDRFLADAKWKTVEEMTLVEYPYNGLPEGGSDYGNIDVNFNASSADIQLVDSGNVKFQDYFEESRLRVITAFKMSFAKQHTRGALNEVEARVLIRAAEKAVPLPGECIDTKCIARTWKIGKTLPKIKRKLEYWLYGKKEKAPIKPKHWFRLWAFKVVISNWFEVLMQFIIVLNMIPIGIDFAVDETWANADDWGMALEITNWVFVGIYVIEIILRLLGLGLVDQLLDHWTQFDMLIVFLSITEIALDVALFPTIDTSNNRSESRTARFSSVAKLLRILRALRLLRLSKTILPEAINSINRLINKRLSFGYNTGKGFVTAEEEVGKLIDTICENKRVQAKLREKLEANRLQILKAMGLLQRDYPGIVISVKTKNVIRTLINISKDAIVQLSAGGVLDETEIQLLDRGIEIKLKRLGKFPPSLAPCEPEDVIRDIVWVKGLPDLLAFVKKKGVWRFYDHGDVITSEDGPFQGIHLIVHGIVKTIDTRSDDSLWISRRLTIFSPDRTGTSNILDDMEESNRKDILGVGTVIGDMALLTRGHMKTTVTCETAVQTHFISVDDMEQAFTLFPGLRISMWKVAAVPIATQLYIQNYDFQGNINEVIQNRISQGFIEELTLEHPRFLFTEGVLEVLLIYGAVVSTVTMEVTEAPYFVTADAREVEIYWDEFAILLVVPRDRRMSFLNLSGMGKLAKRSRTSSYYQSSDPSRKGQSATARSTKVAPTSTLDDTQLEAIDEPYESISSLKEIYAQSPTNSAKLSKSPKETTALMPHSKRQPTTSLDNDSQLDSDEFFQKSR